LKHESVLLDILAIVVKPMDIDARHSQTNRQLSVTRMSI